MILNSIYTILLSLERNFIMCSFKCQKIIAIEKMIFDSNSLNEINRLIRMIDDKIILKNDLNNLL